MKPATNAIFFVALIAGACLSNLSCKTSVQPASSAKGFGWDEDLKPPAPACGDAFATATAGTAVETPALEQPTTATTTATTTAPTPTIDFPACNLNTNKAIDSKFCQGVPAGSCFSLILRIPNRDLISDFGLNSLSLASSSPAMAIRLQEACEAAWTTYKGQYKGDMLHPLRRKFVNKITKMRCIFNFMSNEYINEDAKLAANEVALSVRMSKFYIEGVNTSTTLNALNLIKDTTTINTSFRSVFLYAGSALPSGGSPWKTVPGFGVAPYTVKRKLESNITWALMPENLMLSLSMIDLSSITDPGLLSFVTNAKSMVSSAITNQTPASASFALLGMGYSAVKLLCGPVSEFCRTVRTPTPKLDGTNSGLLDFIPTADANEAIRMGLISSINGILDKFFETAKAQPVEKLMGLAVDPIPIGE